MRRTLTATATAALLALTGCASSSGNTSETPAQQLRDIDAAIHGNASPQAAYDTAFKTLSHDCQEQGAPLANTVGGTLGLLQKDNINDETNLTVMQHLAASIPDGMAKMKCVEVGGAYVALRQGK